jgi:hypothetical protein
MDSLLPREGEVCFGRALRCSLSVQERLAKEPGLGILCRMPTEDPRAGPKLVPLLHTKAPSFQGPAVAAKQTEVSRWKRCRRDLNSQLSTLKSFFPPQADHLDLGLDLDLT